MTWTVHSAELAVLRAPCLNCADCVQKGCLQSVHISHLCFHCALCHAVFQLYSFNTGGFKNVSVCQSYIRLTVHVHNRRNTGRQMVFGNRNSHCTTGVCFSYKGFTKFSPILHSSENSRWFSWANPKSGKSEGETQVDVIKNYWTVSCGYLFTCFHIIYRAFYPLFQTDWNLPEA